MSEDLSDCRVVVTAGASGIGLAIATMFKNRGAQVHIGDVNEAALADCQEKAGLSGTVCDVSVPAEIDVLFSDAVRRMGGISVLVNNAGIKGPTAAPEAIADEEWDRVIAVNISGMFYAAKRIIPFLRKAGGGSIVNMSSAAIRRGGFPLRVPYAVSKTAVLGLTETLAMDLGEDNIRVNSVLPGTVLGERLKSVLGARSAITGLSFDEEKDLVVRANSIPRPVTEEEVAEVVAFLCSPSATSLSGQAISVCGNFEGHRSRQ